MPPELVPMVVGLITAGGAVGAAWLGARALRWVNRKAAEAAAASADLEKRKVDRDEWETLLDEWRKDVRELRRLRSEDRAQFDTELRECRARIVQLEADREQDRTRIRRLSTDLQVISEWSRRLIRLLRSNNIDYPAPPFDLGDTGPRFPVIKEKPS